MNTSVTIRIEHLEDWPHMKLVTLSGQVDESNLSTLEAHMEPLLGDNGVQVILFNFRELEFINSRVIGYFLSLYSQLSERDRRMVIVEPSPQIMDILSLVGLTTLIHHYGSLPEALEGLA